MDTKKGNKVLVLSTHRVEEVMDANESQVFTYEANGSWYHPTKVIRLYECADGSLVTVPDNKRLEKGQVV